MLPALSHLCGSGDRERQIHAVAAIANIAEMVEGRTQKRMIEEGCVKPLLALVDSPDVRSVEGCVPARADIQLCVVCEWCHDSFLPFFVLLQPRFCHILLHIFFYVMEISSTVQLVLAGGPFGWCKCQVPTRHLIAKRHRRCCRPLRYYCEPIYIRQSVCQRRKRLHAHHTLPPTHTTRKAPEKTIFRTKIFDRKNEYLKLRLARTVSLTTTGTLMQVEVRVEAARALALFASKRDSQAHLVRSGVVPKLVSFVRGSDPGVRRYGVLGLGNLGVVTQNHQTLFEAGGVSSLLLEAVYAAEDLDTRRCVAFALNNIASFEPNHRACERAGVLRPLVRLLKDPDPDTHLQAVFAIRQLSVTARCRSQLVEMKGLPPLLRREQTWGYEGDKVVSREPNNTMYRFFLLLVVV